VDLYLLGYLDAKINKWRFFDDAELQGSGHKDNQHALEWTWLGFKGGYSADAFTAVDILLLLIGGSF
jgi:hypothetical protein